MSKYSAFGYLLTPQTDFTPTALKNGSCGKGRTGGFAWNVNELKNYRPVLTFFLCSGPAILGSVRAFCRSELSVLMFS